jgi:hypothetical protein
MQDEDEAAEPLCMTYEPPDKKPKSSVGCGGSNNAANTSSGSASEMAAFAAASGLMDFQQFDGIYDKVSSFCADSLLKAPAVASVSGGPVGEFAFDAAGQQAFGRFGQGATAGSHSTVVGNITVKESQEELSALSEDQAWALNYRAAQVGVRSHVRLWTRR